MNAGDICLATGTERQVLGWAGSSLPGLRMTSVSGYTCHYKPTKLCCFGEFVGE